MSLNQDGVSPHLLVDNEQQCYIIQVSTTGLAVDLWTTSLTVGQGAIQRIQDLTILKHHIAEDPESTRNRNKRSN